MCTNTNSFTSKGKRAGCAVVRGRIVEGGWRSVSNSDRHMETTGSYSKTFKERFEVAEIAINIQSIKPYIEK